MEELDICREFLDLFGIPAGLCGPLSHQHDSEDMSDLCQRFAALRLGKSVFIRPGQFHIAAIRHGIKAGSNSVGVAIYPWDPAMIQRFDRAWNGCWPVAPEKQSPAIKQGFDNTSN